MKGRKFLLVSITVVSVFLISLVVVQLLMADAVDEFDSPILNEELWDMKLEGDASYEIEDGILIMTSPSVESGAILYYPFDIDEVDIAIEAKVDVAGIVNNITLGFIAELMEPQINDDINDNWQANFFFVPANWYIKQDPIVIGEKPPNPPDLTGAYDPDWNVVKIDSSASRGEITFYLNGDEAGTVEKNPDVGSRYFYITCDPYTSHYSGEVAVEYVKFSGPGAPNLAVEFADKLATTWGTMKN